MYLLDPFYLSKTWNWNIAKLKIWHTFLNLKFCWQRSHKTESTNNVLYLRCYRRLSMYLIDMVLNVELRNALTLIVAKDNNLSGAIFNLLLFLAFLKHPVIYVMKILRHQELCYTPILEFIIHQTNNTGYLNRTVGR